MLNFVLAAFGRNRLHGVLKYLGYLATGTRLVKPGPHVISELLRRFRPLPKPRPRPTAFKQSSCPARPGSQGQAATAKPPSTAVLQPKVLSKARPLTRAVPPAASARAIASSAVATTNPANASTRAATDAPEQPPLKRFRQIPMVEHKGPSKISRQLHR
jgi:hypothetical protein